MKIVIIDKDIPKKKNKRKKYLLMKYGSGVIDSGNVYFTTGT